jgi:peptidoglycan/xylan/chitin deacetylase (PgdA/CDA1 family)
MMGNDIPYIVDADGKDMVEVPVHWELDDVPYFNYSPALGMRNVAASPEQVYQVWSAAFEGAHHYRRSFLLTMHPHCIGRPGRLRMLERLIEYIKGFDNIEFMRVDDVAKIFG